MSVNHWSYAFLMVHRNYGCVKLYFFSKITAMKTLKKICASLSVLTFILFAANLTGCSDKEAEAEIARLTQENATLQKGVDSLQQKLDSLNDSAEAVKKTLDKLDMGH